MEVDKEKLITFVNRTFTKKECPMCGRKEWTITGKIFEMREFNGGSIIIGGSNNILPVIPISCDHCGTTLMINPLSVDVLKDKKEKKEEKEVKDGKTE